MVLTLLPVESKVLHMALAQAMAVGTVVGRAKEMAPLMVLVESVLLSLLTSIPLP